MFKKEESGYTGNSEQIRTLISEGCKFEGNLFSPSSTRIDGNIIGDLTGEKSIIIGDKGNIKGKIIAPEVVVYGIVDGDINTDDLTLKQNGTVNGDIEINNLSIEKGAKFNGNCKTKGSTGTTKVVYDSSSAEESVD